jgi:hypothetical protein
VTWRGLCLRHLQQVAHSWRAAHEGNAPQGIKEQRAFKEEVKSRVRTHDEENWIEAAGAARHVWKPLVVPGRYRSPRHRVPVNEQETQP